MNYCVVIPKYTDSNEQGYYFPIGIAYVASSLRATGRNVFSLNLNYKKGTTYELLKEYILENKIDVVATGGITSFFWQIQEIIEAAKSVSPNVITCVGGGLITSSPVDGMMALEIADYGIIGEGEHTICDLAEALEGHMDISKCKGIIYRDTNGYHVTPPREECEDLDQLPFPDYDGFEYDKLLDKTVLIDQLVSGSNGRVATVCFSRSCPFHCTFCFHPTGSKYRRRSLENIFLEIDYLIERYHIENINIVDELFLGNMKDIDTFCYEIKKRNIGFSVSLRVDMVNDKNLVLLKESGCRSIIFGLESADNTVLKSMRKNITIEKIEKALALCNKIGVNFIGNFIFGDQAETNQTARNTIKWWKEHPEYNNISLIMIRLYPGSVLYDIACERNLITDRVAFIKAGCPLVNVSKLSDKEYRELAIELDTLPKRSSEKQNFIESIYLGTGKVRFKAYCPRCGGENDWPGLDVFHNTVNQICQHCNASFSINVFEYCAKTIKYNYSRLAKFKIAFWPISNPAGALLQVLPEILIDQNVYLIDNGKCGVNYKGKFIHDSNIITKENIDIIFLTVSTITAHEITRIIMRDYPQVKHILFAGALTDATIISKIFSDSITNPVDRTTKMPLLLD